MFQTSSAVLIIIFVLSQSEGFSLNKTAELISTYAKVAHWGTASTTIPENEGRSNGQRLWTHRSDVNIKRGQNLRKQPVTYYYSMQAPSSKVDQSKEEPIPSKGEVQERFNPRPYFDFVFDDRPRTNPQPNENNGKPPSVVYGTPVDSFPPSESKPSSDAYSSPFSSYNPPNIKPDDSKNIAVFPPNENQAPTPPSDLYETPNDDRPVLFATPDKPPPSGPYVTPPSDVYGPSKPATEENMKPAYDYSFPKRPDHFYLGPPPPNNNADSDSYFAPPSPEQGQRPHPPDGPPVTQTVEPPGPPYHDHHHGPSMAEEDLAPPVPEAPYGKIPQYLDHQPNDHDLYHFGHHDVYHEVHHPTTTTTEAPRAGPYSYYYLGRKLWYIPLYFSVYFIVYVTILILKSIARHKIQFSHNFDKGRNFRELNDVNQSVMESIENAENKYM